MFTGIIEETGTICYIKPLAAGAARIGIQAKTVLSDLTPGASVSVNGVCLTAVEISPESFQCDLAKETLDRSNLGDLKPGSRVNLERPLLPTSRLSGHIVQGHVDATAEVIELKPLGDDNWWLTIAVPDSLERYFVHKGSISIDGVSLTIATLDGNRIGVTIIPHTYEHTAMREYVPGTRVNIECDVIAKHVERLLASR
jgi:riboflavin synthase